MSFRTLSAIHRHDWLILDDYVSQNLGLIMQLARGEKMELGMERVELAEPTLHFQSATINGQPACAVYSVTPGTSLGAIPVGSIVQMDIIGPVLKYGDMCSYGSTEQAAQINRLAANGNVAGIILNIDSPGGQAAGTQQLADAIKAATKSKPVVAVIDDGIAASAAMWVASAASEIYTTKKTDQVGSIGVFTTLADWYSYAAEQGLKVRDVYAPQSTDKNGDVREALAGNDEPLKQSLGNLADAFISAIQTNRAGKLTTTDWNTGKMYPASQATKMGLIDGTKPYPQIVKRVEQLATNRSNTNQTNMTAFARIMATAGITEISVVDGGFQLTEENLNALESHLEAQETAAAAAQDNITGLTNQITERDARIQELTAVDHQATIQDLQTQITARDQQITDLTERLAQTPAKPFTSIKGQNGDHLDTGANKYETSFDREKAELRAKAGK